ncbi:hypothetical protein ACROYT_G022330 [Oculina patagonica]
MAQKTNDFPMTISEQEQKPTQVHDDSRTSPVTWQEFVDNTTLHGIRYVFMKRHILIRLLWLVLLLTSGGYYSFTVYRAFNKYYSRPINTVLSIKHLKEMDFPAVTICSLNLFAKSKILMTDDNPWFASSGLNISSCAVTSGVRGNRPCGLSMLCCCLPFSADEVLALPNCTQQYQQDLLAVMQKSGQRPNIEEFYQNFGQDVSALVPLMPKGCTFGLGETECSAEDFVPMVTPWGMCYTFNLGTNGNVRTVNTTGVSNGLSVILDAQTNEYTQGKFSEGFKVIIHGQGEYVDQWEGINVGPGQHAVIALSQKRFENLEKPYATNCTKKTLKTFSTYTSEGCLHECQGENIIKTCKCRIPGYKDNLEYPACTSHEEEVCMSRIGASLNEEICDCQVPCAQTKYNTEVSYSKFPDAGTAETLIWGGYPSKQYLRDNLVLLQVGYKSLSYEMQEQQPAYDSNSLFGEIGGNMGLFLGCSLLTICEFFDFVISFLAARNRQTTHPA